MILMTLFNEIKVQYGGYPPWAQVFFFISYLVSLFYFHFPFLFFLFPFFDFFFSQLVGWIIAFIPLGVIALFFVLKKVIILIYFSFLSVIPLFSLPHHFFFFFFF